MSNPRKRTNEGEHQMRMTVKILAVVAALGLLLAAVPARAHHSFAAAFDENHPINLQGTVTKVELVNPTRGSGSTSRVPTAP